MRLIVQKFGGSSLATPHNRTQAADHIIQAKKQGYAVVVVVSAIGRKGDAYATDTLLNFFEQNAIVRQPRDIDLLLSCGELIAAAVMSAEIANQGMQAIALSGWQAGIITDGVYGQAEIIRIKKERILRLLQENIVVVVAGFQGVSADGEITTLGRGGSDTTAVALGAALEAEVVEIYSDVDAVMTADPRIVPEAKPIKNVGYQEVLQMAREGAKVIHPRAVDIALQYNLPLLLKKTGANEGGTLVTHQKPQDNKAFIARQGVVTGITHVTGLAQVRLAETEIIDLQVEEILKQLWVAGISIDLISFSPKEKMFTILADERDKATSIIRKLGFEAKIETGLAKVTVVGTGMRGIPGVMARIVSALNKAKTPIMQTADSHLNVSCLILENHVADAVRSLHLEFSLHEELSLHNDLV